MNQNIPLAIKGIMNTHDLILQMNGVHFSRAGTQILQDLSWTIRTGEHWALIGANGCGKTTSLRIASGTEWPSSGYVSLLGKRFGNVDLRELRKQIGWVSAAAADKIPHGDTTLEVVVSGLFASFSLFETPPHEAWAVARQHLADFNCARLADRKFGVLSQGERQKVMIARALMASPRLLILDEPCGGLDLSSRESLLETIEVLMQKASGPTIVFVTHHIEEICPSTTHVIALKNGQVHTIGSKPKVLTGDVLSDVFDLNICIDPSGGRYWPRILPSEKIRQDDSDLT